MKLKPEIQRIVDENSTPGRVEDLLKRNAINHSKKFQGGSDKWKLSTLYCLTYVDYLTEIVWSSMERSVNAGEPLYFGLVLSELRDRFLKSLRTAADNAHKKATAAMLIASDPSNTYLSFIARLEKERPTALREVASQAPNFEDEVNSALKKSFFRNLATFAYANRGNVHSKEKMRDYLMEQIRVLGLQRRFKNDFLSRSVNESRNPYIAAVFDTYIARRS